MSDSKRSCLTIEWIALATTMLASAVLIVWVMWRAGSGYDFSDEGSYLHWIANPWNYQASVTQFGFIYHPLYRLVGGDIVQLRRSNIFITLGLGWVLCFVLLKELGSKKSTATICANWPFAGVAVALSTSSLALLNYLWLPTPSYNSLTLQGLLIAGTGMILAEPKISRRSVSGWILIGLAGWLTFMAKPTSAAALGIVLGAYLLLSGKMKPKLLAISLVTFGALLLFTSWLIDGSIRIFALRLVSGVQDAKLLQGQHTLGEAMRWDDFVLSHMEKSTLFIATLLIALSMYLCFAVHAVKRWAGAAMNLLASFFCLMATVEIGQFIKAPSQFQGLLYWAAPFGSLLTLVMMLPKQWPPQRPSKSWSTAMCFAAFPLVYAFGTNNNYWLAASSAAIFWVLIGVSLIGSLQTSVLGWQIFLPLATASQLYTATLLSTSMDHPFRQSEPLRQQHFMMQITDTGSTIQVSREISDYLNELQLMAAKCGFKPGEPMLDLTGHFPGALFALGAKSVGRPWMIGGYAGSDLLAHASLDREPREKLRHAWILTEPDGPRKLSPELLMSYGLDLNKDYIPAGSVNSPTGEYPKAYKQYLLKPAVQ